MKAKDVYQRGIEKMKSFSVKGVMPALRSANEGAIDDVLNTNGCAYYQWTPGVVELLKPKQVVEIGGAMGVWTIMALHNLPDKSKLYSITLPENGLEFCYIIDRYPNLIKVIGNDLDPEVWPEDTDLFTTDLWFFDSEHTEEQLRKEWEFYKTFFKRKAILLFDDIHLNEGMERVWEDLKENYDYFDATDPLHYSGFGICTV